MKAFKVKGMTVSLRPNQILQESPFPCPGQQSYVDQDGIIQCLKIGIRSSTRKGCGQNEIIDLVTDKCICSQGSIKSDDRTTGEVVCIKKCSDVEVYNWTSNSCDCTTQNFNNEGRCAGCAGNLESWNADTNQCECESGSVRMTGICMKCSLHASVVNGACICDKNYMGNGNICRPLSKPSGLLSREPTVPSFLF